jgi:hypothetical protein
MSPFRCQPARRTVNEYGEEIYVLDDRPVGPICDDLKALKEVEEKQRHFQGVDANEYVRELREDDQPRLPERITGSFRAETEDDIDMLYPEYTCHQCGQTMPGNGLGGPLYYHDCKGCGDSPIINIGAMLQPCRGMEEVVDEMHKDELK